MREREIKKTPVPHFTFGKRSVFLTRGFGDLRRIANPLPSRNFRRGWDAGKTEKPRERLSPRILYPLREKGSPRNVNAPFFVVELYLISNILYPITEQ